MFHLERPRFRSHLKPLFKHSLLLPISQALEPRLLTPKSTIDDIKPLYTTFCSATTSKL